MIGVLGAIPASSRSLVTAIAVTILLRLATCIRVSGVQFSLPSCSSFAQFWSTSAIVEPSSVSRIDRGHRYLTGWVRGPEA